MRTFVTTRRVAAGALGVAVALPAAAAVAAPATWAPRPAAAFAPRAAAVVGSPACVSGTGTATCDLWAKKGTLSLPTGASPASVPVWGYAESAAGAASAPGPVLVVNQGDAVTLTVHNVDLPGPTSLSLPQVDGFTDSDRSGAGPGAAKTYTFTASRPGTYLYQAGAVIGGDGPRQVAMGLAGALIVRPTTNPSSLDGTAGTAFVDEAALVLTEVDNRLNTLADPSTFDMRSFAPRFRLINGKAYPDTLGGLGTGITTAGGNTLLLRIVNAGLSEHALGGLGLRQKVLAMSGRTLAHPYDVFAETVQPGQSIDTLITLPAAAATYPLYETAAGDGVSGNVANFSGMLTYITATGTTTSGPAVTGVTVAEASPIQASTIHVSATVTGTVTTVEYRLDSSAWSPFTSGAAIDVSALSTGTHTVTVRAFDGTSYGSSAATFVIDRSGPAVTGLTLTPAYGNGTGTLSITATGDDSGQGGSNVTSASYTVDGGTPISMILNLQAPVVSLTGTFGLTGLTAGAHTVTVTATDALGNVGSPASATLLIDTTGPAASNVSVNPPINNGTNESRVGSGTFAVSALITDPDVAPGYPGRVGYGEGFFDTLGAAGTGFAMLPNANATGSPLTVSVEVPLSELTPLAEGTHTILVRGRDAAGNWGTGTASGTLIVDRIAPTTSALTFAPNPTRGGVATLGLTAANLGAPIVAADYAVIASNGTTIATGSVAGSIAGNGTSGTIAGSVDTATLPDGTFTLSVTARTAGGLSSTARTTSITVNNRIFVNSFQTTAAPFGWTSRTGTAFVRVTNAAGGVITTPGSGSVPLSATTASYVTDVTPVAEPTYHATVQLRPQVTTTGASGTTPAVIFSARSGATLTTGAEAFRVEYQRAVVTGQIRSQVRLVSGAATTAWVTIASGTGTGSTLPVSTVRVDWAAGGTATLTVAGSGVVGGAAQTVAAAGTTVEAVFLGRLSTVTNANLGTLVFDTFDSARTHLPS